MISVVKPNSEQLEEVSQWPIWEKEPSAFDWDYTEKEMFYLLEGDAVLSSDSGLRQHITAGDLVTVEQGILMHWQINAALRKHYKFF